MTEPGLRSNPGSAATLLVWDAEGSPPVGDWTEVLWRDFGKTATPDAVSIPRLVEAHADDLRKQYLAWIFELGEIRIKDRRLIEHLELRPGFSAWWMSLLTEMSYGKSAGIFESIRMIAFENWIMNRALSRVVLVSPGVRLADCMRSWCARSGVAFEWQRISNEIEKPSWRKRLYQCLPHPMQALIWLIRHLLQNWPLRGVGQAEWRNTKGRVTFVSYLFNLVPGAAKDGRFESRYWAHLPDELQREGCKTNWLHLYVKDELLPNGRKAADAIRQFNETGLGGQTHVTLDAFLDLRVVFKTLRDWQRMAWIGRRLQQVPFSFSGTALDLRPLMEEDWRRSMSGQTAMNNALVLNLFESALKSLPKQRCGVYLQENQGWEFALIHAWKAAGHGRLIGSPHSTVRYWDLRYFFDPRSFDRDGRSNLPLPDQVALNGLAALDAYRKGGYPLRDMIEVEALRYMHLEEFRSVSSSAFKLLSCPFRVLVLGDYLPAYSRLQMNMLEQSAKSLPAGTNITIKPHPACPISADDYPRLHNMIITMEPIANLLSACDVVYTSASTSAAVDAYCSGVPVVSVSDPNTFNLSPLRGSEGIYFANSPQELIYSLISAVSSPHCENRTRDFFTLDRKLPRWRKLMLESIGGDVI
jgi:surface carbohydrate biosynthesis protein (TIGR04326 family)